MKKRILLAVLCCLTIIQSVKATVTDVLTQQGFEDIRVNLVDSVLYASVEPTAYRGTFRGAAVALLELGNYYPDIKHVELVITEYQMPQVAVHACRDTSDWQVNVDYASSPILKKLKGRPQENNSAWRFDVTAYPMVSLDNHRFDVLYEFTIAIAPTIEGTLWPGNRIVLQPVFPIVSNVWMARPESHIHIGVAAIQQEFRLSDRLKTQVSGGFFMGNFLGLDAQLTYRAGKAFNVGLKTNLVAEAYVDNGKYNFGKLNNFSVLANATYYHSRSQLEGGLTGGRFVYGDWGARLDITRHFGEYAVGIFGIYTGGEYNAGFHFAIPFTRKRQLRKHTFRFKLPDYYDMEYNMESFYKYADEKMGRQVETRPDINHSAHYWQAAYVEQFLRKYLNSK